MVADLDDPGPVAVAGRPHSLKNLADLLVREAAQTEMSGDGPAHVVGILEMIVVAEGLAVFARKGAARTLFLAAERPATCPERSISATRSRSGAEIGSGFR
ncbi:hypothetical protein GE300_14480 [Rhodobacteraceae bacterium 2CG4]|uniref:Uncharacterized protein n=1 Tax=Halovulum marinum TaxID=2662447 RepID=A0A6L5Z2Q7_9RHOB|nr:hypothetical protein [Halovulum marinum]MSU90807.1 hypothetical protein [Halovulum marinum]